MPRCYGNEASAETKFGLKDKNNYKFHCNFIITNIIIIYHR